MNSTGCVLTSWLSSISLMTIVASARVNVAHVKQTINRSRRPRKYGFWCDTPNPRSAQFAPRFEQNLAAGIVYETFARAVLRESEAARRPGINETDLRKA